MDKHSTIIEAAEAITDSFEKRILVVDDVDLVCRVVATQLNSAGFREVKIETDPLKVVELVKEFKPAMILLDIFMPNLSGLELLKFIRANPEFDHIIILMLSSAGVDEQYQSLEQGAFGFIQKPTTAVKLVQTVTSKFKLARRLGIQ